MAWRASLGRRAIAAAAGTLILAAAVLSLALVAVASTRAASRELSHRLVPAAAAAETLLKDYQGQQSALRAYVTSGAVAQLAPFRSLGRAITPAQARLASLVQQYPRMPAQLRSAEAAQRTWLARIAAPQLAAAARGDFAAARAMQANIPHTRPYSLAVRNRMAALQGMITNQQGVVTSRLVSSQDLLIGALVAMCALVAVIAAGGIIVVRRWLLRPFTTLRRAAENVAAGDYANPIPADGPEEFADLARSTEHMRTKLVEALAERERAEQSFRRLFEAAPDATLAISTEETIVIANAQAESLFGFERGALTGQHVETLVPAAAMTIQAAHRAGYFADSHPRAMGADLQLSALREDGSQFPAEMSLSGLSTDGQPLVIATIRDITERLALQSEQERLRAGAGRQRTQQRLQQAQKLESLGQLVGGVAHDFNNLLNIITGYTDLSVGQMKDLASEYEQLQPVLSDIGQVRDAADQAIRVTRQLLTFARHDVVEPEVLDLNDAVTGAGQMLNRTIGEHISLEITTEPDLWAIKADQGQLEQVLVNLAVNARDAMPRGGKLTIDTHNLTADATYAAARPGLRPGRYVRLRVSDTGTGMDQATIERVFEPFFTTKAKGHGTGLGLATVYGIVTQAGGAIQIYSEPGFGTTITALFPATTDTAEPRPAVPPPSPGEQQGHGETVLLLEDEESLRGLANRILTGHGYRVVQASDGPHAVRHVANPARTVDLLLTDIVMPGMLGTDVAERVHQHRPGLPVIYMSGYAQPILDTHGATGPDMDVLEKPFTEATLLARIHQALHKADPATTPRALRRKNRTQENRVARSAAGRDDAGCGASAGHRAADAAARVRPAPGGLARGLAAD